VALLATLRRNIATYEKRIEELVAAHPDGALFASLPGAGAALVPRLITAFGTQRDRFDNAYQVQCYSGIAPVTEASGKSHWVHFRWSCPKFFRQTFQEYASQSIRQCEWARDYYQLQPRSAQISPRCRARLGLQMDSHHFPLLEGRQTLRRADVPELRSPAHRSLGNGAGSSHRLRVEGRRRLQEILLRFCLTE
jgi:hypothetical protein